MTTEPIFESGMEFGPYPAGTCFYLEKSSCYRAVQTGVKMAEFSLLKHENHVPTIWVVEAKSSSPRPETRPNFDEFIDDIREKLTNGFLLTVAAQLKRHAMTGNELPEAFCSPDLTTQGFRFVLIINGHKEDWLPSVKSKLDQALKPLVKIWGLHASSVAVLNQELAQQSGLILAPVKE